MLTLAVIVSIEGTRRLSFDSDVLSLLPRDSRVIQAFRAFLSRFGTLDQLYVVLSAPEGHAISEYADEIDAWTEGLRAAPEILRVDAGTADRTRSFAWLADRQLLILHDHYLDEALQRLSPDHLSSVIAGRRDLLSVPSADVVQLVRQDPAGLFELLRDSVGGGKPSSLMMGISDGAYVTPDGRSRLLLARPRRPPYDAEFSRSLDARLKQLTAAVAARPAQAHDNEDNEERPPIQVQFAGGHRIAVETEAVVKRESIWNSVGSLIVILPLLYLVFRSLWLVTVGSLPSALSLLFVLGGIGYSRRNALGSGDRVGCDAVRPRCRRRGAALRRPSPGACGRARVTSRRRWQGRRRACCSACGRRPRHSTVSCSWTFPAWSSSGGSSGTA